MPDPTIEDVMRAQAAALAERDREHLAEYERLRAEPRGKDAARFYLARNVYAIGRAREAMKGKR